ncbi:hypothetical protein GPALN_012749 [Globodera pallida]|nr:hypothetical protein GPALN_012749 [Globodera pallida]
MSDLCMREAQRARILVKSADKDLSSSFALVVVVGETGFESEWRREKGLSREEQKTGRMEESLLQLLQQPPPLLNSSRTSASNPTDSIRLCTSFPLNDQKLVALGLIWVELVTKNAGMVVAKGDVHCGNNSGLSDV